MERMKKSLAIVFVLLFGMVLAHSQLKTSRPRDGSTVKIAPKTVMLEFNEGIEIGFSTLRVIRLPVPVTVADHDKADAEAAKFLAQIKSPSLEKIRVDNGIMTPNKGQASKVTLGLKPLKAGWYGVIWRALGTDTHPVSGAMTFRVKL
jgi:methionine-rich copper-binding protein CopC